MSSIAKFSIKNVRTFRGNEGDGVNADVYYDGKKIGTFDDFGDGGETQFNPIRDANYKSLARPFIEIANEYLERTMSTKDEFYREHPDCLLRTPIESVVEELLSTQWFEKQFKANVKKGYPVSITYRTKDGQQGIFGTTTTHPTLEVYGQKHPDWLNLRVILGLDEFVIE